MSHSAATRLAGTRFRVVINRFLPPYSTSFGVVTPLREYDMFHLTLHWLHLLHSGHFRSSSSWISFVIRHSIFRSLVNPRPVGSASWILIINSAFRPLIHPIIHAALQQFFNCGTFKTTWIHCSILHRTDSANASSCLYAFVTPKRNNSSAYMTERACTSSARPHQYRYQRSWFFRTNVAKYDVSILHVHTNAIVRYSRITSNAHSLSKVCMHAAMQNEPMREQYC